MFSIFACMERKDIPFKNALWMLAVLLLITYLVYSPARYNTLTNWDDKNYVRENKEITKLDKDFVKKSFSVPGGFVMGNYHPLTMLSYAYEYKQSQLNPKPYHTHNIILHICNAALVFFFVILLCGRNLAAFLAAAFFALHPMHVESVAWVAERKDLLFVFFGLLSLIAYLLFIRKNNWLFYFLAIVLFVLALLGKAMAVSIAAILFLIDYYLKREVSLKKIILEKIPFLLIAIIFGIIAIKAQHSIQAIDVKQYSFYNRILFASYACFIYLVKAVIPYNLNCYYDYPVEGTYAYYIIYVLTLIGLAAFIWWKYKHNRLVIFSLLFFLIAIAQVLQLLPVGGAIVAERYTYMPYVGLFILPSVLLTDYFFEHKNSLRIGLITAASVLLVVFASQTYKRCFIWKDTFTIWQDALSKKPDIVKGLNGRGDAYNEMKNYRAAITDFSRAIQLNNAYTDAYYNRGISEYWVGKQLQDSGKAQEAISYYNQAIADNSKAIELSPSLSLAYFNRAGNYFTIGAYNKALADALKSRSLGMDVDPKFIEVLQQGAANSK